MSRIRAWVVGREPGCDVVLRDGSVSRRHAEVVCLPDGRLHVTDCATMNGTFILRDGEWRAVRQTFAGPADRIRFGDCELTGGRLGALCPRDDSRPDAAGASAGGSPPSAAGRGTLDSRRELMSDPETGELREREAAPVPRPRRIQDRGGGR